MLVIGIFLCSLITRLLAAHALVTIDEATWMSRSVVFVKTLAEFDLSGTYLKHHPGVTLMWLNGTGFVIHWIADHLFSDPLHLNLYNLINDITIIREQKDYPISLYVFNRAIQAVITSCCMVALFLQTRKLLGHLIALLGIGLLISEPFFLGYQRLLLTDVLQINLVSLSLVSLLLYLRGDGRSRLLVISGIMMGLAVDTKVTALFALPAIVIWIVLIELGVWRTKFSQRGWGRQIRDIAIWIVTALASIFVIWPALWVDFSDVLTRMIAGLQVEAERGLFFFLGQNTDSIGASFYPVVLLYRLSPLLLAGTLIGLLILAVPKYRQQLTCAPELTALTLVSLSFLFMFSTSGNKLDRYILPAIPGFAFLAAAGWLEMIQVFGSVTKTTSQLNVKPFTQSGIGTGWQRRVIISLITLQFTLMAAYYPYYLTYFNPLLGGAMTAQHVLMVGNGEGLDQAAKWLNQLPQAREVTVGSGYGTAFAPYFQGRTLNIRRAEEDLEEDWLQKAHYLVFYINQFQRQLPSPKILNYFAAQKPLYTVHLQGVDYVQIYQGAVVLPEQLNQVQVQQDQVFADVLRLRGYEVQSPAQAGQSLTLTLYWEVLQPPSRNIMISVGVQGSKQQVVARSPLLNGLLPKNQMVPGLIIRDLHQVVLPADMPEDTYVLEIGFNHEARRKVGQLEVSG